MRSKCFESSKPIFFYRFRTVCQRGYYPDKWKEGADEKADARRTKRMRKAKVDALDALKFQGQMLGTFSETPYRFEYLTVVLEYKKSKAGTEKLYKAYLWGVGAPLARAQAGEPVLTPQELVTLKKGPESARGPDFIAELARGSPQLPISQDLTPTKLEGSGSGASWQRSKVALQQLEHLKTIEISSRPTHQSKWIHKCVINIAWQTLNFMHC